MQRQLMYEILLFIPT